MDEVVVEGGAFGLLMVAGVVSLAEQDGDELGSGVGGVTIHIGPEAPVGRAQNWTPTVPGKAWFPYFRLYSPTAPFLDRTWVLPDIERAA